MGNLILNDTLILVSTLGPTPAGKMRYLAEFILVVKTLAYTWPVIILLGFFANITNIIVFLKVGVKDNVTILLISLSFSDLAYLSLFTPTLCGLVIDFLVRSFEWPFHKLLVIFLPYWPAVTVYDISAFLSVSLGVMRCACVAMPLKFKLVFTKSRTVIWVIFIVILAVSLRAPVLTIFRIRWRQDPITNISSIYLASVNRPSMLRINDTLNRGFLIWFNYVTMITCVLVLSYKLYLSSKLRQSCAVKGTQSSDQTLDKTVAHGMSAKDLQICGFSVLYLHHVPVTVRFDFDNSCHCPRIR